MTPTAWREVERRPVSVTLYHLRKLVLLAAPGELCVLQHLYRRELEEGKLHGMMPAGYSWWVALGMAGTRGFRERVGGEATSASGCDTAIELILDGGLRCWTGEWRLLASTHAVLLEGKGRPEAPVQVETVDGRGT